MEGGIVNGRKGQRELERKGTVQKIERKKKKFQERESQLTASTTLARSGREAEGKARCHQTLWAVIDL